MQNHAESNADCGTFPSAACVFCTQILTLAQAARRLPSLRGGKPTSPRTVFRWGTAGRESRSGTRVRLEIGLVGKTNCTCSKALARFFDHLNDAPSVELHNPRQEAEPALKKQATEALALLKQRGLIE